MQPMLPGQDVNADADHTTVAPVSDVLGLDHVELYVSNARQAAHFYQTTLGFAISGYAGYENGHPDDSAYLLNGAEVPFVLRGPVTATGEVARFVAEHGDGVRNIALAVADADVVFHRALLSGAAVVHEPRAMDSPSGRVKVAAVQAFDDVIHSLIERDGSPWFLPTFDAGVQPEPQPAQLDGAVDHLAICVREGELDRLVAFYTSLGLAESYEDYVTTGNSAMRGRTLETLDGRVRLPCWEAGNGPRQSQVNEFVRFNQGSGVQHIAFRSDDIVGLATTLRTRGVEFLPVPEAYYSAVLAEDEDFSDQRDIFRNLGVVVDRDRHGYLLQAFTRPLQGRPTFFWEIIERRGARSFGGTNIRKLFEAVEREQQMRGTF